MPQKDKPKHDQLVKSDSTDAQNSEEFLMAVVAERASNNATTYHDPGEAEEDVKCKGHSNPAHMPNQHVAIRRITSEKQRVSNLEEEEEETDQFTMMPGTRHMSSVLLQKMAVKLVLDTTEEDGGNTTMKEAAGKCSQDDIFNKKMAAQKSSGVSPPSGKLVVADTLQQVDCLGTASDAARKRALRYVEHEMRSNSEQLTAIDEDGDNNACYLQEPDLQRGQEFRYASQRPGAYAQSPGEAVQRNDTLSFSRLIQMPRDIESGISPYDGPVRTVTMAEEEQKEGSSSSDSSVVEARPVTEENNNNLVQAQPVNLEAKELQKVQRNKKQRHLLGIFAVVVMIFAAVISTTIIFAAQSESSSDPSLPSSKPIPPSQNSTILANNTQSPIAPASTVEIMKGPPSYTIESLKDPFSHQSKALNWLATHPYISKMEEWRKRQLFALACIYYSLNGPNWPFGVDKDWLDYTKHECFWFSSLSGHFFTGHFEELDSKAVPCNEKGEYRFIVLEGGPPIDFYIENAVLPPEVSFLTALESVKIHKHDFRNTSLSGLIPSQLAELTKLTSLQFSYLIQSILCV